MFDFYPKEIDFLNEEWIEELKDRMHLELYNMLEHKEYTISVLEELLFMAVAWIMPVINKLLDFKAFNRFSELKNSYQYVLENWKNHEKRPYPKMECYINMCYNTGPIVGEDDEETELTYEEIKTLREEYFSEREQKESDDGVITLCDYHILENYFYFLDYFMVDESGDSDNDRDWHINFCVSRINNILFDVLWYVDYADRLKGETESSCFMKAVKEIGDMDNKVRS